MAIKIHVRYINIAACVNPCFQGINRKHAHHVQSMPQSFQMNIKNLNLIEFGEYCELSVVVLKIDIGPNLVKLLQQKLLFQKRKNISGKQFMYQLSP